MPTRTPHVLHLPGRAPAALATALAAALMLVSGLLGVLVATASPAASAERTVKIGASLSAADLTVQPGTTVTWEATDGAEHRVRSTSGPVKFDSGNFTGSWSFTFDTLGSYAYLDHRHESLTGTVTVSTSAPGGAGGGGGGGGGTTPAPPKTASVSLVNKAFSPVSVTVAIGGTVTWKNNDSMPHDVTSTSGAFRSPTLNPGQSFTFTFTKAGSYGYFCTFHGGMSGTVVVPTASGATPAPTPPGGGGGGGTTPGTGQTGTGGTGTGGGGGAGSKTIHVTLKDSLFSPSSVKARVGDTIVWHNAGAMPHTVTAADKSFDQQLMPGATFTYVLRKQGTIGYVCTYHPGMKGTLVVGAAPAGVTLPPPGAGGSVSGNQPAKAAKPAAAPPAAKGDGTKVIEIKVLEMTFEPKMAEAHVGDTISWVNTGTIPHTVTAKDKSFDRTLQPGERFNYVLRKAGNVDYVCTFHPGMDGMLMVKPALAGVKVPAAGASDEAAGPAGPAVHRHGSHTTYEVQAKDDAFSPALLDVRAGDTVVWVNVGATKHRVQAEDGSFDATLAPGKKLTVTFEQTGTVRYADPAHPGMFGAVVVRTAPVAATSGGPLSGLPMGPAGAVGALVLVGLLAGAGAVRRRAGEPEEVVTDLDGTDADDEARLLGDEAAPELEPVP